MPKPFDDCVKNGGKVRTISGKSRKFGLKEDEYIHICFLNGQMFLGEKKQKNAKSKK